MRIVEGRTGTGPATWPRGQRATWHRANGHMAVGHPSRLRPQRWGVRANSIVDSIRQEPDPHCGSGFLPPQRPTAETSGMPALRHMRRLGNWLARLAVDQVPCGHAGSSPARRTTCARRDQPTAGDGSRLENGRPTWACEFDPRSLRHMEGDAGVARRPVATRVVAPAMRFDSSTFRQALSVQVEWTPACRAGDHGFESRTERAGGRRGRGGCWLPIRTFNPGRAGSIPVHGTPHAPPWSSGQGRPVLSREDAGSSPAGGTEALVAEPADAPPSSSGAPVACGFDSHREHREHEKHTHLPER
jgi:hypothetical protein